MRPAIFCLLLLSLQPIHAAEASEPYYVAFLRREPSRPALPKDVADRLQAAHMANIHDMAARGILAAAGPFDDTPSEIAGIFVFRVASMEEARRVAGQDPTVAQHRNRAEVYLWRGPKGIGDEYFRLHKEHPEMDEGMGIQPLCVLRRGPAWNRGGRESALAAQEAYLEGLRKARKLGAGGAVEGDADVAAIEIFQRIPLEEAKRLMADSPAVKSGLLQPEYHQWWSADHVLPR
jgi:uncharacterized protein YciI